MLIDFWQWLDVNIWIWSELEDEHQRYVGL